MRAIALALAILMIAIAAYYLMNPPKPKVVVVGPPQTATATNTAPPTSTAQTQPPAQQYICNSTMISVDGVRACGVIQYQHPTVVVAAPGWLAGKFQIVGIQGPCVFNVQYGELLVAGSGCVVTINIPS
jgi:hypothetical protein